MMGPRQVAQGALFYKVSIEEFVPLDHPVRGIDRFLDLSDVRPLLAPFYSSGGRPSIDPERMIRMLLLGYCMGVQSERRLCEDVHFNLAHRWVDRQVGRRQYSAYRALSGRLNTASKSAEIHRALIVGRTSITAGNRLGLLFHRNHQVRIGRPWPHDPRLVRAFRHLAWVALEKRRGGRTDDHYVRTCNHPLVVRFLGLGIRVSIAGTLIAEQHIDETEGFRRIFLVHPCLEKTH